MALYRVSLDAIALVAVTAKTLVELATGAGDRALIKEWWLDFDSVTAAHTPVRVEIGLFDIAISAGTAVTPAKMDPADGPTSVTAKAPATTEGAGVPTSVIFRRIPPTSGYHYVAPLGQEVRVPVSSFWRIRALAGSGVNATFGVIWED